MKVLVFILNIFNQSVPVHTSTSSTKTSLVSFVLAPERFQSGGRENWFWRGRRCVQGHRPTRGQQHAAAGSQDTSLDILASHSFWHSLLSPHLSISKAKLWKNTSLHGRTPLCTPWQDIIFATHTHDRHPFPIAGHNVQLVSNFRNDLCRKDNSPPWEGSRLAFLALHKRLLRQINSPPSVRRNKNILWQFEKHYLLTTLMVGDHVIWTFFEDLASAVGRPGDFSPIAINQHLKLVIAGSFLIMHQRHGWQSMTQHKHHLHQCDFQPSSVTFDSTCEGPSSLTQRSQPSTSTSPFSSGTPSRRLEEVLYYEIACLVWWLDGTPPQGRIGWSARKKRKSLRISANMLH